MMTSRRDEESQPIVGKNYGKNGKLTLAVIAMSNLFAWSCMSLTAPFFPIVAAQKGVNDTLIGMIYSSPELVIFLTSPIFGKLLSHHSPKFFYIAGLFVFGCCGVMYGWLDQAPPGIPFVSLCFAVRIVAAVGTASFMTASFAIAGEYFPDKIGTVYGILETVSGTGFMVGPAIGGVLYQSGGFGLPFWGIGGCVFVCGIASYAVLPSGSHVKEDTRSPSSLNLFRSSTVWFGSSCLVVALFGFGVWEPVFAQYLKQFNLSQSVIGLIFVIPAATSSLTTPLWGLLLDRNIPGMPLMITGLVCGAVCILFFGPAPFLTFITPMLWLTILTIALLGLALAPVVVSSMRCIVDGARELGFKDEGSTFGLIGGIVQSANCLGTFSGPLVGGAVTDKFGFGWAMVVSSVILILPILCFTPFLVITARRRYQNRSKPMGRSYIVLKGECIDNMAQLVASQSSMITSGSRIEEDQPLLDKNKERKAKVTIAVIAVSNLCAWSCISLIAPFFPIEAARKGTSETLIGFIYSCSELVIFLMSPIFGKLLSEYNPRFFYIAGLIVFGSCDVMFGWLNQSPSGTPFIAICFAVRIVEAVGTASIMTASYAIAGMNFPDRIGTVYGILTTMTSCGFLIGPAAGGGLYQLGGFGLPFWVLGSCVFLCGIASCLVLPSQNCLKEASGPSSLSLFRSPMVWFGSISLVAAVLGFTVYEPIFAQHLEQFNLSQSVIGLIFIMPAITYSSTTPLWGFLLDRNVPVIPLMVIGLAASSVCFLFFGPAPFFTFISPELWLTILMLALLGLTLAPVGVSAMRCIVEGARDLGFKDDGGTFGLVGGIVQSSTCIGTFAGPLIGGALTEQFGFAWTMVVTAVLVILPLIVFGPFLFTIARRTCQKDSKPSSLKSYVILEGTNVEKENVYETSSH